MGMNKDNFDKLMMSKGVTFKDVELKGYEKYKDGTTYILSDIKENKNGIITGSVFEYPDFFSMKLTYRNSNKNIKLDFDTKDEAYAMLYRFIYMPDTINFSETINNSSMNVSQEEFNHNTKKGFLSRLFHK